MARQPLQSLDQHQQHQPHPLQDQQKPRAVVQDDAAAAAKPITVLLSRFSRDCTASVMFCLRDPNPSTLAPWNSIYIPKHYRVPIPGQRQSSPGDCDLVLKIYPRLALTSADADSFRYQDLISPCDRCKAKKRDTFQVVGPDPAVPSPQRLFFINNEIRFFFKICCPPSHHTAADENYGYILTFELHHGKRVLMSETVQHAGPGMVPEPVELESLQIMTRPIKRKVSSSSSSVDSSETYEDMPDINNMPRKRSMVMSLANLISDASSAPGGKTDSSFTTAAAVVDPPSPTTAVVPLSPQSYQQERNEATMRSRVRSPPYDDHTPSSWAYTKESRSGSERSEEAQAVKTAPPTTVAKQPKKRQEPHELSELGIGQRASANLHAAYVNGQLRERFSKAGLPTDGLAGVTESNGKAKNPAKTKPSHACQEPGCDKSFSRLFNLRSHMRTHSKARPFVCSSCNFAFSRRHDRDRHAKKHLSEKPYKCIVCEATFVRQDALVRHLRMDGVQNQCMAAMEQRSMLLSGENAGGYMMAAKQQAHDEQQQEDRRGTDEKSNGTSDRRRDSSKESADQEDGNSDNDDDDDDQDLGEGGDDDYDEESAEPEEPEEIEAQAVKEVSELSGRSAAARPQDAAAAATEDGAIRPGTVKSVPHVERPIQASVVSRAPSPHQERNGAHDAGIKEKTVGKQQPYGGATPRFEKGPSHTEHYGDDQFGPMHAPPHPRSFYPSPSRTHSRSHSQSQPYAVGPEYHGHAAYHDSAYPPPPPPPPLGYHSKYPAPGPSGHSYRDMPLSYGYPGASSSTSMPRYHDRAAHDARGYPGYSDHAYGPHFERPGEVTGPQPWIPASGSEVQGDLSELESDKSICDAAMGLLRIRSSQW
ncbi:hypothetical protein BGZ98_001356 [Dissophora globulifera]|nr:hypothetical protein BGZ98_001356 [Dissophora globulifera]